MCPSAKNLLEVYVNTSDNCVSVALWLKSMGFEISWIKMDVDPEIHN